MELMFWWLIPRRAAAAAAVAVWLAFRPRPGKTHDAGPWPTRTASPPCPNTRPPLRRYRRWLAVAALAAVTLLVSRGGRCRPARRS